MEDYSDLSREQLYAIAQFLYQLLDNIDTATDMAKDDEPLYRKIVEAQQSRKNLVVAECDGYTVKFRPIP